MGSQRKGAGAFYEDPRKINNLRGQPWKIGLDFHAGVGFQVDSQRYRLWGADGHAATSPCVTGNYA